MVAMTFKPYSPAIEVRFASLRRPQHGLLYFTIYSPLSRVRTIHLDRQTKRAVSCNFRSPFAIKLMLVICSVTVNFPVSNCVCFISHISRLVFRTIAHCGELYSTVIWTMRECVWPWSRSYCVHTYCCWELNISMNNCPLVHCCWCIVYV